jgi:NTE family protein
MRREGEAIFRNLVFEGGGVRGVAYAGALGVLEERGFLSGVRAVAGTSAGAFAALLLSLGYSPEGLADALRSIHFKTLEDHPNPLRVATHYGLYKGDVLREWIAAQVTGAGLPKELTFAELAATGARDLKVFATDLNICDTREFSAHTTPDTSVVGAVRASMSIPLMYAAWQFPDGKPDNHIYVDGGTVYNYPIGAFADPDGEDVATLGFRFKSGEKVPRVNELETDHFFDYARSLFAAIMSAQTIDFNHDPAQVHRSVMIDDLGYRASDLELSEADIGR